MKNLAFAFTSIIFLALGCSKKELTEPVNTSTVYEGDITVKAGVDLSYLKNVTKIIGSVHITDGQPGGHLNAHYSLDAFKNIKTITGTLTLYNAPSKSDLKFLSSLEEIGAIDINYVTSLKNLEGLENLKKMYSLTLHAYSWEGIRFSFKGLPQDFELNRLHVGTNFKECDLEVFKNINVISFGENSELKTIKGLSKFKDVTYFSVSNNKVLESIEGLPEMSENGTIQIAGNSKLTSIENTLSVNQLKSVKILGTELTNLSFLSNVVSIQDLTIDGNAQLLDLNFNSLQTTNSIYIVGCKSLKTLKGLENCTKPSVFISDNESLENIDALSNINGGFQLTLTKNNNLKSIEAISKLGDKGEVYSFLNVSQNKQLAELCPLSKVLKNIIKARENINTINLPVVKDNATTISIDELLATCK
jgi:Receptor L domain